jgi:hypothetical protein
VITMIDMTNESAFETAISDKTFTNATNVFTSPNTPRIQP